MTSVLASRYTGKVMIICRKKGSVSIIPQLGVLACIPQSCLGIS